MQISKLKKDFKSFKTQVNPSDINFFKLTDKGRKRVRYNNESFKVVRGIGRGHIMTGSETWKDYTISSKISIPLASAAGLILRSQGLKRYYSLELTSNKKLKINKME